jgi:hypothetical protein
LGAIAFLNTAPRSVILGEGEALLALNTLILVSMLVKGQRNTVSRTSLAYSMSKAHLSTSTISIEEVIASNDEVIADSLPYSIRAALERSKEALREGIYSQENIRRRRR